MEISIRINVSYYMYAICYNVCMCIIGWRQALVIARAALESAAKDNSSDEEQFKEGRYIYTYIFTIK